MELNDTPISFSVFENLMAIMVHQSFFSELQKKELPFSSKMDFMMAFKLLNDYDYLQQTQNKNNIFYDGFNCFWNVVCFTDGNFCFLCTCRNYYLDLLKF